MKKSLLILSAAAIIVATALLFPDPARAVPAFARQTGFSCDTCHFMHYPALNAFGRSFKAGGMVLNTQGLIEGENGLSLPDTLHASIITKIRYKRYNGNSGTGEDRGELQFPNEAALFLGGRIAENIGFALEGQLSDPTGALFDTVRIPIVYEMYGGKGNFVLYKTAAMGASFGFELLSTGAVRNLRSLEERNAISAQQWLGTTGAAQGVAFAWASDRGFVNYSRWQPDEGSIDYKPWLHYGRIAITPAIGDWDTGFGAQIWRGHSRDGAGETANADAWALDAQALGSTGEMPVGLFFTYGKVAKMDSKYTNNLFGATTKDKTAWSAVAELGVLPSKATVAVAYLAGDRGTATDETDNALTFATTYLQKQNVEWQLSYTMHDGSYYDANPAVADKKVLLMFVAGF